MSITWRGIQPGAQFSPGRNSARAENPSPVFSKIRIGAGISFIDAASVKRKKKTALTNSEKITTANKIKKKEKLRLKEMPRMALG